LGKHVKVAEIIAGKRKDWFEEPDSKKLHLSIQPALKSVAKPVSPIKKSAAQLYNELFGDTDSESDVDNGTMPVAARAPKVQVEKKFGGRKLRLWSHHFNKELDL